MSTRKGRKKEDITAQRVVEEMARIAFSSFSDFAEVVEDGDGDGARTVVRLIPTARIPPEKRAALAGIKQSSSGVEVKLFDKWRALETLGKTLGVCDTRAEPEGEGTVTIVDDI